MNLDTKLLGKLMMLSAALLLFCMSPAVKAQTTPAQNQSAPAPAENPQVNQLSDVGQLNLTRDQIERIRDINLELRDERQAAGLRLQKARRALAETIESPNPDETLIAQRSREVAEAQANTIRLRSLAEARLLQVLTPEQRLRVRKIRERNLALDAARQRQRANGLSPRRALQGGAVSPGLTPAQRRALRRQPKP